MASGPRCSIAPFGRRLLSCLFALALAGAWAVVASAALADGTEYDIRAELYQRYRHLIQGYFDESIALETTYRRDLVGKVLDPAGRPRPDVEVMNTLFGARTALAGALKDLDAAYRNTPELAAFLTSADNTMINALGYVWSVDIDLTGLRVSVLSARQNAEYLVLYDDYARARDDLARRLSGADYDAARARLDAESAAREDAGIRRVLRDYLTIQGDFISRLKARAGDAWLLQDFNLRRLRRDAAQAFAFAVYRYFCYDLGARDQALLKPLVGSPLPEYSQLDFFVGFPGSRDRLGIRMVFARQPPPGVRDSEPVLGNDLWKMGPALKALPVEVLRKFDRNPPKLALSGGRIEQMVQVLVARLSRFYQLQAEQVNLRRDLARLTDAVAAAPAPPDTVGLAEGFATAVAAKQAYDEALQARRAAQEEYRAAAAAYGKALDAYNAAQAKLRLVDAAGAVQPFQSKIDPAALAGTIRQALADRIARIEQQLKAKNDPALQRELAELRKRDVAKEVQSAVDRERAAARTPDQLRKVIADRIRLWQDNAASNPALAQEWIERLQRQAASIDAVVAAALKPERDALRDAEAARDEAQKRYDAVPDATPDGYRTAYASAKVRYDLAVAALPADRKRDLPALPAEIAREVDYRAAVDKLDALLAGIRQERDNQAYALSGLLGELARNEAESAALAPVITSDRAAGAALADVTLTALGARRADDEVGRALDRLKDGLKAGEDVLKGGKKKIERFNSIRDYLLGSAGAGIIKQLSERLGLVIKVWETTRTGVERIAQARKLAGQLERRDPAEMLEAIGTLFDLAASQADAVPVLGPTFGEFLKFYGKSAVAAGEAINRIQAKIIETDLRTHFTRAERHLYTLAEIEPLVREGSAEKVRDMVQVRRLVFLIRADSLGDVRDIGPDR